MRHNLEFSTESVSMFNHITPQRRALLAAAFSTLALVACGKQEAPPAPVATPAPAAAPAPAPAKVYIVGTDAAYAPFEKVSASNEVEGLTVDLLKAAAAKGGFEVKFVNTPWEGIFKTLDGGERDIVASSVTITDERKQSMDFSKPYFDAVQLIAVKEDSKVAKFDDLKKLKVGVQTGTTGDEVVQKLLGKTSANIKRFESTPLALQELAAGGVSAVVADNGVVQHYIANNPTAKFKSVSDASFVPEQYGFAVKKGNAELLAKLNTGIDAIKADGSYDTIMAKYFGAKPAAAPAATAPASTAPASTAPASAASK
jgi:polar amino acid transport system substrate-binding protein